VTNPLRRRKVDSATEKNILTAMIVSTPFLQEVEHLINYDYFQNSYIRKVARWCVEHFERYEVAPFDDITTIFKVKSVELSDEDVDLTKKLLTDISTKYSFNSGINVPYMVDQTLLFFKKRELEITNSNIRILLDRNDIDGAEEQINNFAKISRVTSGWIDPFDPVYVDEVFTESERMFKFPGVLGEFLGGMDRGWLVAVVAGFKKGKTWHVQEIVLSAIQQRLKVVLFALEMGKKDSNKRLYQRIMGAGNPEPGPSLYPCFDCASNQDGTCKKPERTNLLPLNTGGDTPVFSPGLKYRPCTACRFTNPRDFRMATWFELIDRPAYTAQTVKRQILAMKKAWPDFYRFKSYPKFSATLSDMRRDLDLLERTDGFIPDVIIIDQANGVKPEQGISLDGIAPHSATWRGMAAMAGERRALVISPSQINRGGLDKKTVSDKDIASHIGLLGDIDVGYALNQTPDEKRVGIMRYTLMAHRHDDFDPSNFCTVLQKLRYGQVYLDAHVTANQERKNNDLYSL